MDVEAWLQGLGLERYVPAFRDNEVNERVLPSLTAEDLKDLGVTLVGHRRLLLDAIAALGDASLSAASPAAAVTPVRSDSPAPADAERRQLTVMFCDLVGSTALSTRRDPEDLRELIGDYHHAVADTVGRFDGFVAKYMGDGVLIYFGYPQAHEDDADRAVRAGLAVIEAVGRLPAREDLSVRLGLATGLAVVGDLIGEGAAQERGVVGETPNLAARLQGLAAPNTLVIAEATRRQIGGLFDLADLGPQALAGFAGPQPAWRVIGESGMLSRFEALRSGTTPLVGRAEELDLLLRRWEQAKSGEGRVVLISGEPGIGKSRLTAALSEHIGSEPHTRLRYFCSPHHQDSALYPFIAQLERAAGIARDDAPEAKLTKLDALIASGARDADDITLLAELLSLPNAAAELTLSPQRKREKLLETLLGQLALAARRRPVLMVFEDVHWIDPTSRELLDLTVDRVRRLPVLLAITFRPEFLPPWGGRAHVTSLSLNRLGERAGQALVHTLAGNAPLTAEMVAEIVERTDGVPLFVEELTKAVLESAGQGDRVAAVLATASQTALSVPATLHASLMARLDRLGPSAKEIAQIGAVLGREFGYELIEPVAQRPDRELQAALDRLSEAGLLFCRGAPPHASYLFKHALVQDAAYSTLLRGRRQELHARVAAALEEYFRDLVERQPELLAHHLTAAGDTERAVEQWLKAGERAAGRLAHVEAIAHFERGLSLLASLAETPARDTREIELQLALGVSSITVKGMSSPIVPQAYGRARELAEKSGDQRQLFQATYGLWQNACGSGRVTAARPLAERLMQLAVRAADDGLHLQAHHSAWTTRWAAGEAAQAYAHTQEGFRLYDTERHRSHRHTYGGHDPGVCARMNCGHLEWLLGYPHRAVTSTEEAVALAEQIAHPFSRELALEYAGFVRLNRGETDLGLAHWATAEAIRTEHRVAFVIDPLFLRAAAQIAQGAPADAAASIHMSFQPGRLGTLWQPYGLCVWAHALAQQGSYGEALVKLAEGFERIEATGERVWQAELHRVRGLVLLAQNNLDEAQASFKQAIRTAQAQQAKSLELRAARDLARLWGEQGRRTEAHELLASVYGWFTEGFDTADLKDAKTLLDELT
jgi:class 3 adenylate cyclase/tetratricopeptide (TPR) repeat protein